AGLMVAAIIPPLEIVVGVSLLLPSLRRGAMFVCTLLCASFLVVRSVAIQSGLAVDCNCFGSSVLAQHNTLDWTNLAESAALLVVASAGFIFSCREWSFLTNESRPASQSAGPT